MRLSKVEAAVIALSTALMVSGCSLIGYDRGKELAYRTLFDSRGFVDKASYSAAMSAKFAPGTPVQAVRDYAAANDGECSERENGELWCEIAYRTKFCAAAMVGIAVVPNGSAIHSIRVEIGGLSC